MLAVSAGYLQVSPHERRPGLHQVVADGPLAGGGGFVQRRLASERQKKKKKNRTHVSSNTPEPGSHTDHRWCFRFKKRTHVSFSVTSRCDVGTAEETEKKKDVSLADV